MFRLPAYRELSKEQDKVVNLPLTGTSLVVGPPGTGKTVIAIYRANMLKNAGHLSRFIVYNRTLNQYLGTAIDDLDLENSASTFHSWFFSWYRRHFHRKPPQIAMYKFDWNRVSIDLGELRKVDKLPHLIIDEGQDFPPAFYRAMRLVAKNLTIFADENQRLTDENSTVEEIGEALNIREQFLLKKNYRNSLPIAEFAQKFYADLDSGVPDLPTRQGDLPQLHLGLSLDQQVTLIVNRIRNFPNKSVGVFLPYTAQVCDFYNKLSEKINRPVQMYNSNDEDHNIIDFRKNGIMIFAYASAKGLEFDTVFLPMLNLLHTDANMYTEKMRLYVLTSRARENLFISTTDRTIPWIMRGVDTDLFKVF